MAKTFLNKKNNATSTITNNPLAIGAISVSVQAGDGAKFPNAPFHATLHTGNPDTGEIVKVTVKSTDTFTIERAKEGTSAAEWAAGTKLELLITAQLLNDFQTRTELVIALDGSGDYNCDGTDDSTEIQEAIDYLEANSGGHLLIKKGTYSIQSSLSILADNISIDGEGAATILKMKNAVNLSDMVDIGDGGTTIYKNCRIANMQFDCNKANQTSGTGSAIVVYGASSYKNTGHIIENIWAHDSRQDCIRLVGGEKCIIKNCVIWNATNTAIGLFTTSQYNTIIGNVAYSNGYFVYDSGGNYNTFTGNVSNANGYGFYLTSAWRETITGNVGYLHTNYFAYLIAAQRCSVIGNQVYGDSWGIVLGNSASATRNNTIVGNSIAWCTNYGVALYYGSGGTHYNTVSGNTIYGCGASAIYVYGSSYNVISDNTIDYASKTTNNTSDSISIHYTGSNYSTYNVIANNNIQASQANKARYHINETNAGSNYNLIEGNILKDAATANLMIRGANTVYADSLYDMFMDVTAEGAATVHAAITGNGATQDITTSITNPDVPRNITVTTTNNATPSGNVVITGKNARGLSVTDTIAIVAGGLATGVVAFATVTNIQIPAGVSASDSCEIGTGYKLGLSNFIRATTDVYKVKKNTADVAVGTVNVANSTVDVGSITANDDFTIYYLSNLNIC